MMSGELMSLILGRIRAFLAQTRKDLFAAFPSLCSRGYELEEASTMWEGVASCQFFIFLALLFLGNSQAEAQQQTALHPVHMNGTH